MGSEEESISMKMMISVQSILHSHHVLLPTSLLSHHPLHLPPRRDRDKVVRLLLSLSPRYQTVGTRSPISDLQKVNFNVGISFLFYLTPATIEKTPACCSFWKHCSNLAIMSLRACLPYARLPIHNLKICPILPTNRSRVSSCPPDNASYWFNRR